MKRNNHTSDTQIREILKTRLPQARRDDWFVKKVMNRLPRQRQSAISNPEKVSYAIAAITLIGGWIAAAMHIRSTMVITKESLISLITLTAMTVTLALLVTLRQVKS